MKQLILTLMIALMSVMTSTPAVAKNSKSELGKNVPANLIVKQTTQFNDGLTLTKGCVTISSRGMSYLWSLVNKEQKPLLLWSFVSKQS